jgi:acyl-CoA synthetase (AMP-forming)/AMP-acid ligase II
MVAGDEGDPWHRRTRERRRQRERRWTAGSSGGCGPCLPTWRSGTGSPAAVVRVRVGHAAPTLDELREHCRDLGLARPKWPEELHVVADLPRTASGKVQKFRLRQQLQDGPSSPDDPTTSTEGS